jgi:hypothetical protein
MSELEEAPPSEVIVRMLIAQEFPAFEVRSKADSRWMRAIGLVLFLVTLGQMRSFMEEYLTTVGATVYVPTRWMDFDEITRCVLLRHEAVHMRQVRRHGRVKYALLYAFAFFPVFFAWHRAKFEMEAYAESIRAEAQYRGIRQLRTCRSFYVKQFTGPAYLWMWPWTRTIYAWYDQTLDAIWRKLEG